MKTFWLSTFSVILAACLLCSVLVQTMTLSGDAEALGVPDADLLTPEEMDAALVEALRQEIVEKRAGRCRKGDAWNSILKQCMPSLGKLRSRMKGLRRRPH